MGELANVIGLVLGMTIMLHGGDGRQHKEAHIHVFHRKGMSVYSLNGEYMRGSELSGDERKALKLWCQIHNEELKVNWSLALKGLRIHKIKDMDRRDYKREETEEDIMKKKQHIPCYYGTVKDVSVLKDKDLLITFAGIGKKVFDVSPYIKGDFMGELSDEDYFSKVYVNPRFNFTVAWPNGQSIDPENLFTDSQAYF